MAATDQSRENIKAEMYKHEWSEFKPFLHHIDTSTRDLPDAPQHVPIVKNAKKLIFSCRLVEIGTFLIDKEGIWCPDEINVFSTND